MIKTDIANVGANNPIMGVFFLPGRGCEGTDLLNQWKQYIQDLEKEILIVALTPESKEWYPLPRGPKDQLDALSGIEQSVHNINGKISDLCNKYGLEASRIALVGHSAGGVMALQCGFKVPYRLIVSHSGAILETGKVPPPMNNQKIILTHARDDNVFLYDERYLPMAQSLLARGHSIETFVRKSGGHGVQRSQVSFASSFLTSCFADILF